VALLRLVKLVELQGSEREQTEPCIQEARDWADTTVETEMVCSCSTYRYLTGGDGDLRVHEPDGAGGDVDAEHGGRVVDGHGQRAVERHQLRRHTGAVRAFPGVEVVHRQALHIHMISMHGRNINSKLGINSFLL